MTAKADDSAAVFTIEVSRRPSLPTRSRSLLRGPSFRPPRPKLNPRSSDLLATRPFFAAVRADSSAARVES
jgi:hypothetical protein